MVREVQLSSIKDEAELERRVNAESISIPIRTDRERRTSIQSTAEMEQSLRRLRSNSIMFAEAINSNVKVKDFVMTRKTVFCISVSVIVLTIGIVRLILSEADAKTSFRTKVFHLGSQYAFTLERQLKASIFSTYALRSFVEVDSANVTTKNFEPIALKLMESFGGISNLQLAPNAIVEQIIPLAGNEAAIGHDLLTDPNRRGGSLATIAAETTTFVGPLNLIQGGVAVIARNPVFTNFTQLPPGRETFYNSEGAKFWGFVTMLSHVSTLLEPVGLSSLENAGYSWQLINTAPNANIVKFATSPDMSLEDELTNPVAIGITFPESSVTWQMLVAPRNGWPQLSDAFWQLVFLLLATTGFAMWSIYRTLERESKLERVHSLSKTLLPGMTEPVLAAEPAGDMNDYTYDSGDVEIQI